MPGFDATGNYTRWYSWQSDAASGIKIMAVRADTEDDGFAAGLSTCITKDGRTQPTADIPMNGKKLINLAPGIAGTDAINRSQLDSLKTFSTGLVISGTDANGKLTFSGAGAYEGLAWTTANLFFGVENAGPLWVWNDRADNSGNEIMALTKGGVLTLGNPTARPTLTLTSLKKPSTANDAGIIYFNGYNSVSALKQFAYIHSTFNDLTAGSEDASLNFALLKAGTAYNAMVIDGNGIDVVGAITATTSITASTSISASTTISAGTTITAGSNIAFSGTVGSNANPGNYCKANYFCKNGVSIAGGAYGANVFNMLWNSAAMVLFVDNTNLGTINTTSDYRIKRNVAALPSMWDKVKALRPISYTQAEFTPPMSAATTEAGGEPSSEPMFTADDIERWGFIAHETQDTLLMTAASGHKDMEDGVQGLNWAPIVAALTKALQEAMARIEALEARP
jgi:hypothetical protein